MNVLLYTGSLEGDPYSYHLDFCGMMHSSSAILFRNMVGKVYGGMCVS